MPTLAEQIIATNDREGVPVEAWGQKLLVVPMSGTDLDSYHDEMYEVNKQEQPERAWRARFLVRCLCDPNGNRVFADADWQKLTAKNGRTLERLHKVAVQVNPIGDAAVDAAAKNS